MKWNFDFRLPAVLGWALLAGWTTAALAVDSASIDPLDWPHWRGPEQNNVSRETGLVDDWNPKGGPGSNLLWKNDDLGGRCTPIVMRGKLYTIVRAEPGTDREGEKVVCVDAATGEKVWENRFSVYLTDVPDTRVGWSSPVGDPETGRIYALGVCGLFLCLDGETGETIWSHSLHEEFGFLSTYGGRTNFPVILEDMVLVSAVVIGWDEMARPAHRFMAFDKGTGEMIWFNGTRPNPYDTTYSTPVTTVLGGEAALVFGSGDGAVWAMQPRTGNHLWSYPFSRRGLNVSPLVVGDVVYMGHSEENITGTSMGALVALDGTLRGDLTGKELWRVGEAMVGKGSPIMVDGRLYTVTDAAKLQIYDPKTGDMLARKALGTAMRSTPLYADGKIYVCDNSGRCYILEPTSDGVKVLHQLRLGRESVDGSPIVSHGRIYLPTSQCIYCIGDPEQQPAAEPIPEPAQETPPGADDQVAHVQVVPCDVLLKPGQSRQFTVRLFNARGQRLKESPGEFSLEGVGQLASSGQYTAPSEAEHAAAFVQCKVGDVAGRARIRIVPPLPWKFDFNDLDDIPITWIGGRVRYVIREVDGEHVAVKRDNIPTRPGQFTKLGTRSRLWMGPADLSDYTIQADVQGQLKEGKMPDAGLINQRYTLDLMGAHQQLQIRGWDPQPLRTMKGVDFAWKPGVWYTLKMTTSLEDGKAVVRGKAWPRGEDEPDAWTVEAVDPAPNLQGSPGLYGNATDAEFYLDNVTVTEN